MILACSTRPSSSAGEHKPPSSNETDDSSGLGSNTQDHLCHTSIGHIKHRQEQDLLGLASNTFTSSLPNNETDSSDEVLKAISQDRISACPVHSVILSNADALPAQAGEAKYVPMDRYLAEDLKERCAILNIGPSDSGGQWAIYSGCLCEN
jgi:hypothetical protein